MNESAPPPSRRPWSISLALYVLCGIGLFGFIGSCNDIEYLRGSQALPNAVSRALQDNEHPMIRSGIIREKARLEAIAKLHQRTFPLSAARCLLTGLLFFAATSILLGRRQARSLAAQAAIANGAFAIVAFVLLSPIREVLADTLAHEALSQGGELLPNHSREESLAVFRQGQLWADYIRFGIFELGALLAATIALYHPKTKAYWAKTENKDEPDSKPSAGTPP